MYMTISNKTNVTTLTIYLKLKTRKYLICFLFQSADIYIQAFKLELFSMCITCAYRVVLLFTGSTECDPSSEEAA